jgi:ABC-type enterochelin transport system substrate-binding protein
MVAVRKITSAFGSTGVTILLELGNIKPYGATSQNTTIHGRENPYLKFNVVPHKIK